MSTYCEVPAPIGPTIPDPGVGPATPDPKVGPTTPDPGIGPTVPDPGVGPTTPDPGAVQLAVIAVSVLGVLLPTRGPIERLAAFLLAACALLALLRQRRSSSHRPISVGLTAMSATDSISATLRSTVLTGGPYFGPSRAAFHAHEALTLAGIFALPAMVGAAFLPAGRGARLFRSYCLAAFGVLLIDMIAGYPSVREMAIQARSEWLEVRYLAAEAGTLMASCFVVWRAQHSAARTAQLGRTTVACLIAGSLVLLPAGAWTRGLFGAAYSIQQAGLAALYLVVLVVHARALQGDRRPAL